MTEISRICDKYDIDVSIWYPAMAEDYGDPKIVEYEIRDWAALLHDLPRVDIVFVPGGDPGHTNPKNKTSNAFMRRVSDSFSLSPNSAS